jgi:putative ABC transport system permease protein
MKGEIPGIKNTGRLSWYMDELAIVGDKSLKINGIYADPSILTMYTLPFAGATPTPHSTQVQSVVISESMAKSMFGGTRPHGQDYKNERQCRLRRRRLYTVTGVFKDLPANCNYQFQWVSPFLAWKTANPWVDLWDNPMPETMIVNSTPPPPRPPSTNS